MCDLSFEDRCEFWKVTERRARVEHRCACCDRLIAKGERYSITFAISDGSPQSEKACAECHAAIQAFGKEHNLFPFPTSLQPYLEECIVGDDEEGSRWRPMLNALLDRRSAVAP